MNKSDFFKELYNLYGPVTRARNCFLYTKKGIRVTDCYQENGRAILGWDGGSAFTHLKNVLSRGQTGSFICEDHSRLEKALSCLLKSDRKLAFYYSKIDAVKAGLQIAPESTAFYQPWSENNTDWPNVTSLVIAPPLPWTESLFILAIKSQALASENQNQTSEILSPATPPFALQVAITRSIYNLIEALQTRQEKDWFIYDPILTKYFERKGPYLYPKIPQEKYDDFVIHCLKLGIAFNPDYKEKSIVPFGADKGVFTKLKNSPFDY